MVAEVRLPRRRPPAGYIEPNYNQAVDALLGGSSSPEHVKVIAGFIAYVASCSPAAMRLGEVPLTNALGAAASAMDRRGLFPSAPAELGGASLTELLNSGVVRFDIDRKYPQALGIGQVLEVALTFESCDWEMLHSDSPSKPFMTSDFPASIERTHTREPARRVVALAPGLAVRVTPGSNALKRRTGHRVPGTRRHRKVGGHEVVDLNRAIVRCAEELVFYRDEAPWVVPFVDANRHYRVTAVSESIPRGRGSVLMTSLVVGTVPSASEQESKAEGG